MGQGYPYGNPVTVTDPDGNTYINTYYGRGRSCPRPSAQALLRDAP